MKRKEKNQTQALDIAGLVKEQDEINKKLEELRISGPTAQSKNTRVGKILRYKKALIKTMIVSKEMEETHG